MDNKVDVVVAFCYHSPSHDELFCRQLEEISGSSVLILCDILTSHTFIGNIILQ